ncbi:tRNA (34-2'-O)-methyltransferase regulator WDR6-like isoform X2 [Xylocopa sonorina]|uniref:tRNA (34-2'-O)-methyltransferase regulator WDR6-like isoform X2 n=1 Tax=Xylocopa sonorina TaxID=1818115 RepID=UPI00403ABE26
MFTKLLCTDVLAVRCINNIIFIGMGCTLYAFDVDTFKLINKISCSYPYNIHGIVEGPNNKLTVFGANFFCTFKIYHKEGTFTIEECSKSYKKELNDWIIAAKWLTIDRCDYLCVLLAHNNVRVYDLFNERYQSTWCEEKCILYAGSISINNNNKDIVIFSGTVYQEILIWEINHTYNNVETSPVLHRLQGHNGVIFSVAYDPLARLICSTSDDRTVRLWKINSDESDESNDINWKEASVKLVRTMFGHTARVWKCIIRDRTVITIGEDSLMCTWSLDGKLLSKICAHHGAAIWSIDTSNDNKTIFTGGADGAVHAWPAGNGCIKKVTTIPKEHACTLPKYVCCLSSGNLLIFNENGFLFIFDKCHSNLQELLYLEKYNTYCVMEVSLCHSYVCLASRDGYIAIYKETEIPTDKKLQKILEEKIMEHQIFSVQWLKTNEIVICGINGILKIFNFTIEGSITMQSICLLPRSRERWLTAAVLYKGLLVCGDRAGNMHVFEFNKPAPLSYETTNETETDNKPIQTFVKIHGTIGVQNFIIMNSKLISAGRDGMLRFYELCEHKSAKLLCTLHKEKMPMDWISGHLKYSNDTLILGFKEMEFIIYSMVHRRILARVPCGGGHRSWDCMLLNELITFIYIRSKEVHKFDFLLNSLTSPTLLNGFHTKEIHCINPISKIGQYNIFISGGEDGTLRISYISSVSVENNFTFRTLGGRAQMKVWEIDIKGSETLLHSADISCHDITSHMLYGFDRHQKKQCEEPYIAQPETRYMDVEIYRYDKNLQYVLLFVACADGFVRIFLYDIKAKKLSLKASVRCVDRCISKITILTCNEKVIALTMSTDGIGRFIDFTDYISKIIQFQQTEEYKFQDIKDVSIAEFDLHQSGINSYDIKMIGQDEYLLGTGGDDNLFSIIRFKVQLLSAKGRLDILLLSRWSTSATHAAQITGVIFHEKNTIFTVGLDQQVIMYRYDYNDDTLSVTILQKIFTFVTDSKGITSWYNSRGESVACIYGRGFETLITK